MSGSTTELGLTTADDDDDNADYLTIGLKNALITLDALQNASTGHNHSGAHQGAPIIIGPSQIPAGTITSAMIADGSIQGTDLAQPLVLPQALVLQGGGYAVKGGQGEATLKLGVITIPAGQTAGVFAQASPIGLVVVTVNGGGSALLLVHGGSNDVTIVSDPKALWSIGTVAGKSELFYSGGSWWIRNSMGASATYYAEGLGL